MQFKNLLHGTIALGAVMLFTGIATAQSTGDYRSRQTGDWDQLATWERYNGSAWVNQSPSGAPPDASSFVTIRGSHTVTVDTSEAADHLDCDGFVVIAAGGTLTLDGSGVATHDIAANRTITLSSSTSVLQFVDFPQIVDGGGKIVGQNSSAKIQIEEYNGSSSTLTLECRVPIEGMMTIEPIVLSGTGSAMLDLTDNGIVHANAAGVLALASGLLLDDAGGVRWEASGNSSAVLQFNQSATLGNFVLDDCAMLEFFADVGCAGLNASPNGTIETNGYVFTAGGTVYQGTYVLGNC
jgi:hypothetical protein